MKLPRDLSGEKLASALRSLGYETTRQTGSHMRLTTHQAGEHHVTVPRHPFLKLGTLSELLTDIGRHHRLSREALLSKLFD